jgi:SAM-dependent methyltransferase
MSSENVLHHYNDDHNATSALQVVPYILEILQLKPKSVVDVGCGLAQWLKVFKDNGIEEVLGIDGAHVPLDKLNIDTSEFRPCDLRQLSASNIDRKFDLLLCLEVAEHLEAEHAQQFISSLVSLSDTIIFAAAVPNQTGENHFNEQYADYWANIFAQHGYSFLDPFRAKLWNNDRVNWWYRQNLFLVVKKDLAETYDFPYDGNTYIHPKLLEMYVSIVSSFATTPENTGMKVALKQLVRQLGGKLS